MQGTELLQDYFEKSKKSKQYLSHKLVVSRPRLDRIFENPSSATVVQANVLKTELYIDSEEDFDAIFLP